MIKKVKFQKNIPFDFFKKYGRYPAPSESEVSEMNSKGFFYIVKPGYVMSNIKRNEKAVYLGGGYFHISEDKTSYRGPENVFKNDYFLVVR